MNISELKEMARQYWQVPNHNISSLLQAILSLPDDDGEELVRLAEALKEFDIDSSVQQHLFNQHARSLARAVLSRYSKREETRKKEKPLEKAPRAVALYYYERAYPSALFYGTTTTTDTVAVDISAAFGRLADELTAGRVSGIEGVSPDQPPETE